MSADAGPRTLLGSPIVRELDVHGLTAEQAARRVRDFVMTSTRTCAGQVVRIVTGKGTRSAGPPVLMPLVRDMLDSDLARYVVGARPVERGGVRRAALGRASSFPTTRLV